MIYVYEMLMKDIHVHCISCCCLTLFWHFFAAYSLCFHLILIMKCWWKMNILQVRVVQPISDIFFLYIYFMFLWEMYILFPLIGILCFTGISLVFVYQDYDIFLLFHQQVFNEELEDTNVVISIRLSANDRQWSIKHCTEN